MGEPCKVVPHGGPLCLEEVCIGQGNEHTETASFSGESNGSLCSLTSNLTDDATSSPPSCPASSSSMPSLSSTLQLDSGGPLYELSPLLNQLPIRKGLSKYYQGKSQSFTSLSDATCIQDLAKQTPYNRRMKTCKSYAAGLDVKQRSNNLPRPCSKIIVRRSSGSSSARLSSRTSSTSLLYSSAKPPSYQNSKDA